MTRPDNFLVSIGSLVTAFIWAEWGGHSLRVLGLVMDRRRHDALPGRYVPDNQYHVLCCHPDGPKLLWVDESDFEVDSEVFVRTT